MLSMQKKHPFLTSTGAKPLIELLEQDGHEVVADKAATTARSLLAVAENNMTLF